MEPTIKLFVAIALIIFIYGSVNYYIGLKIWEILSRQFQILNNKLYWPIFWFFALSYLFARLGERIFPEGLNYVLLIIGSYWFAVMLYFFVLFIIIDLIKYFDRWLRFLPGNVRKNEKAALIAGLGIIVLAAGTIIYGHFNARNPVLTSYTLDIPKKAGALEEIRAVLVSDIHLGRIIDKARLVELVNSVNRLEPDVVLLAGDIIDEDIEPFISQNMSEAFLKLKSRFGVYGILGNHEYYGGDTEDIIKRLEASGIKILRDDYLKVAESIYIAGRDDIQVEASEKRPRKALAELMEGVDKSLPVILMNHRPENLDEAKEQGVDLQLSGHTHRGQLFPINLITGYLFECDWGYIKKDNLNVIVSSGYGTWGPPIRTGNRPEIVSISLKFKE